MKSGYYGYFTMGKKFSKLSIVTIVLAVLVLGVGAGVVVHLASSVNLSQCDISLSETSVSYTGKQVKPELSISYEGTQLKEDTDYLIEYSNNVEPGKAHITLTGTGDYRGTAERSFTIVIDPVKNLKAKYLGPGKKGGKPAIQLSWDASGGCTDYEVTAWKKKKNDENKDKDSDEDKDNNSDKDKDKDNNKDKDTETASSGQGKSTYHTKDTTFRFEDVSGNGTYEFTVAAIGGTRKARSDEAETSLKVKLLKRPEIVSAESPGAGRIDIEWKEVSGAQEYIITEKDDSSGQSEEFTVPSEQTQATFLGKALGNSYSYNVRAVAKIDGKTYKSSPSESKSASPAVPIIGQAAGNEKGGIRGGAAGDQKGGREVCTSGWKYSSKQGAWNNWQYVARFTDPEKAIKAAEAMRAACENEHIGYDQGPGGGRGELKALAEAANWDLSAITTDCEVSCSPLVGTCVCAAGVDFHVPNSTSDRDMLRPLQATGEFEILTDSKYTTSDKYLQQGDILVSPGKHTGMVL